MRPEQLSYDPRFNEFVLNVPDEIKTPEDAAWYQINKAYEEGFIETFEEATDIYEQWEVVTGVGFLGVVYGS